MIGQHTDFFQCMADVQNRDFQFCIQTHEIGNDFGLALHIQRCQRFIHQHDIRTCRQCTGDTDALLFSA